MPYFSTYAHSEQINGGLLNANSGPQNAFNIEGNLIEAWYKGNQHGYRGIHFAATKERPEGVRWIFISNNSDIYRLDLTCDTLESTGWKYRFNPGTLNYRFGWRNELEVYEDTVANLIRVAVPYHNSTTSGQIHVAVFELDADDGTLIPGSSKTIDFLDPANSRTYVHGVEFTPDGKGLYITHEVNGIYSSPLSFYNIASETLTQLSHSSLSNFKNSQLQIAKIYDNYSLMIASNNYIGRLSDPNSPDMNNDWNEIYAPLDDYQKNLGGNISYAYQNYKHIVPDQIDYEDYEDIFLRSCDCCNTYAYAGKNKSTTVTVNSQEVWEYGVSNNPWGAESGDIIYIRDALIVEPGASLTIKNMKFKFAPDARAIVKRGSETHNGGKLYLRNGTVFSADFRCSSKNFNCDDPNNDCNSHRVWQGVRVEGHTDNLTQSSQKQATFTMESGSMIEYAKIGARAGHESLSGYGGGILKIKNSIFKDNITGIHFDEYSRIYNGVELFNYSVININTFKTTDDFLSNYLPQAHINIHKSGGLSLKGNIFENTNTSHSYSERGIGVKMSDSRVSVSYVCNPLIVPCSPIRSEFKNLHYGIYGLSTFDETRSLECNFNIFHNNERGVFLSNYENPRILDNAFFIANIKSSIGLDLLSSSGYIVENNTFEVLGGTFITGTTGISVRSSGPYYNEIYKNDFSKLSRGGRVVGKNADPDNCDRDGLQWLCNTFGSIWHSDITLASNSTMSDEQGSSVSPAGNLFSHSSLQYSNHYDLHSLNAALPIKYFHHFYPSQDPRLIPIRFSGMGYNPSFPYYTMVPCSTEYNGQSCPVKNIGKPSGGGPIDDDPIGPRGGKSYQDYADLASSYATQLASLQSIPPSLSGNSSEELDALISEARTFWHELTMLYQWDTLGTISSVQMASLLTTYQPESIERFASSFLGAANASWVSTYAQANANNSNLPAFVNGALPTEIPSYFESDFFSNLGNVDALNALYIANNAIYHPHDVEDLPAFGNNLGKSNGDPKSLNNEDVEDSEKELSRLIVTPNPFRDHVKFDLSAYTFKGTNNQLEFYDLLGKKVHVQTLNENQTLSVIQGSELPEGVIIYTLYVNGEPVETGKIVRVK